MKVYTKISEAREAVSRARAEGKTIGLVPTMGYLHKGHTSLVKASQLNCGFTVVSIFVNPTQFGPSEDYKTYPRNTDKDLELLDSEETDMVFVPPAEEMYQADNETVIATEQLSHILEGRFRPGHFNGVCTIVCKLFNIITPDRAYFGWKDAQQLIIIRKMARDLNIPVEIVGCPTIRETDGLAASSRNIYIPEGSREKALCLYRALKKIEELSLIQGMKDSSLLIDEGKKIIEQYPDVNLQYLEIVETENLKPVKKAEGKILVLGAVKLPQVRLIDNIIIEV